MPVNPKVQLTRLALGIAGAAAVAGLAGRFASGPGTVAAAPAAGDTAPEAVTEESAPSFFAWFDDNDDDHDYNDDDDDDDEEHHREWKERGYYAGTQGGLQFAQPSAADAASSGTTAVPSTPQPRTRTKRS